MPCAAWARRTSSSPACGARRPRPPRIVLDADRPQQHRGVGVALLDLGGDGRGVVAVGEAHRRRRPGARRRRSGRVDVAQLDRELGHAGARARRSGSSSARPSRSTRPSPPPSRMRGLQRGDALGHVGPGGVHRERAGERGAEIAEPFTGADAGEQAVDGAHAQLAGGELHHQGHDRVGARIVGPRRRGARPGSCPRSRSGGGRRPARAWRPRRRRRWRGRVSGSVMRHSEWWKPSSSVAVANGSPSTWSVSADRPVASDRPQIGSRLARVARSSSRRSLLAFGSVRSWGITSPPALSSPSAPITPVVRCGRAVVAGEVHPVDGERGLVVGGEHAVGLATAPAPQAAPS